MVSPRNNPVANKLKKRLIIDHCSRWIFMLGALFAIALFICIVFTLAIKSTAILSRFSLLELLFTAPWDPERQLFGFFPAIVGTFYVTALSMAFAVPISILSALYLAEYIQGKMQTVLTSLVDVLAAVPSVVFGLFGLIVVAPFVNNYLAPVFGMKTTGYGIMTASLVLSIMVFPIIISLTVESINSLPDELRESALALGDTHWGLTRSVLLRAAGPGIISAVLLGFGRAFGETIAAAMVIGGTNLIPASVFSSGQTLPSLLVNTFGEMMSLPLTQSALIFVALILLIVVTAFNILATVTRKNFERKWRY